MTNPEALAVAPAEIEPVGAAQTRLVILASWRRGSCWRWHWGSDYGISWDEPDHWRVRREITDSYARQRCDSVFVELHFYGPFCFLVADGVGPGSFVRCFLLDAFTTAVMPAYFLSLSLATPQSS